MMRRASACAPAGRAPEAHHTQTQRHSHTYTSHGTADHNNNRTRTTTTTSWAPAPSPTRSPFPRTRTSSSRGTSVLVFVIFACHFRALRSSIGPQPQIKSKPKLTPTSHSIQVSSGYEIFTRAKYLGGDLEDYGASTVADPSDPTAVYSLGTSLSPVFSLNTGPLELLPGAEADGATHAFLVRLDGPSSRLLWAKSLGPIVPMNGTAPKLAVHGPSKALYVAGASFLSFPPAAGNGQSSTVLRLDTDTGDVVWARNVPQAWALAVQPA